MATQLACVVFHLGFAKRIFYIVTTQNDHPGYEKHPLACIDLLFTPFGYWVPGGWGGSPKGLLQRLLVKFFPLGSSKFEVSNLFWFDIVITSNDHAT